VFLTRFGRVGRRKIKLSSPFAMSLFNLLREFSFIGSLSKSNERAASSIPSRNLEGRLRFLEGRGVEFEDM
jgi:hypothetical protein